mgnify:CR=1 FL=1
MFTVFVLGNIASGKSTACRYFESRGAMLIDLDELAKSLYVPGSDIVNTLADEFGWDILDEEGAAASSLLELSLLLIRSHGSMALCIPF